MLAGLLLGGMRQKWPDMRSSGIGGPRMEAQGFEAWWPYEKLAVRGYVEGMASQGFVDGKTVSLKF